MIRYVPVDEGRTNYYDPELRIVPGRTQAMEWTRPPNAVVEMVAEDDAYWIDLGRRAVACKGWRWPDGAKWIQPPETPITNEGPFGRYLAEMMVPPPRGAIPDFRDPATLGCLLRLVRDAWGDEGDGLAVVNWWGWDVFRWGHDEPESVIRGCANSEAGALLAALEAAP